MFVYSSNNPLLYSDPDGHSVILTCIVVGSIIGAIAGGVIAGVVSNKKTGKTNGWAVAGGAVLGALGGGIVGAGIGAAISALGATAAATTASGTIAQAAPVAYKTWQNAEQGLRQSINSVSDYASRVLYTPAGNRVVDAYNKTSNVIAEAKYGYQSYSNFIKTEVARDSWLLQNNVVKEVQWHFYASQASESIGGSYPLIHALLEAGIQVFYH